MFSKLLFVAPLVLLVGCNGGSNDGTAELGSCSIPAQNQYVYDVLKQNYLWPERIPNGIDASTYSSPEALLNALRYREYDRGYSYITTEAKYNSQSNNEYKATGIYFKWLESNGEDILKVRYTDENSPARAAGVVRSDQIIEIDGMTIPVYLQRIRELNYNSWNDVMKGFGDPDSYHFKLRRVNGSEYSVTLAPQTYTTNTVHDVTFFDTPSNKVAYFAYKNFSTASRDEFNNVFSQINTNQSDALILDLRMNPGGSVLTADDLATRIAGAVVRDQVFANLVFNSSNQDRNYTYMFRNDRVSGAVSNLSSLYVLTSDASCSASEMLINSLEPFIDVQVIGSKTCGKPIGMTAHRFCENILFPIEFQVTNARNEGGYFNGIETDCSVSDDYAHQFGDETDPLIAQALQLASGGSCNVGRLLRRVVNESKQHTVQNEPSQFKENFF